MKATKENIVKLIEEGVKVRDAMEALKIKTYHTLYKLISRVEIEQAQERHKETLRVKFLYDLKRGLTYGEIAKRYDTYPPLVSRVLGDIIKPNMKHHVVPLIVDHYNGATIDELSLKYDLDPMFVEKQIVRQQSCDNGVVFYDVVVDYCIHEINITTLTEKYGVSRQGLQEQLKRYGYVSHREIKLSNLPLEDVIESYESGETISRLSSTHEVGGETIKQILLDNGVRLRKVQPSTKQISLMKKLYARSKSAKEIGDELGFHPNTVLKALKDNGVTIRKAGSYKTSSKSAHIPRDELRALREEGWSLHQLADKYGVSHGTITNHLSGKVKYNPKYHATPSSSDHSSHEPSSEVQEIIQAYEQGADLQEIMARFGDQIKKIVEGG
jgi:lambda repressor-like predicted transcriptional regulator